MLKIFDHLKETDRVNIDRYLANIRKKFNNDDFKHDTEFFNEMTDEEGKYQFHYALEDFTVNEDIRHVKILVQNTLMDNKTTLYGKPVFLNRIYYHNKLDLFVGVFYIFENNKDILQTMPEELADYVQKCIEERKKSEKR